MQHSPPKRSRLTVRWLPATNPMPRERKRRVERLLAILVAEAFAADHPEFFGEQALGPDAAPAGRLGSKDGGA